MAFDIREEDEDRHYNDEFEEYEDVKQPQRPKFYRRKKFWMFCIPNAIIAIIIAVVLALYVIMPKIAQGLMNKSVISLTQIVSIASKFFFCLQNVMKLKRNDILITLFPRISIPRTSPTPRPVAWTLSWREIWKRPVPSTPRLPSPVLSLSSGTTRSSVLQKSLAQALPRKSTFPLQCRPYNISTSPQPTFAFPLFILASVPRIHKQLTCPFALRDRSIVVAAVN